MRIKSIQLREKVKLASGRMVSELTAEEHGDLWYDSEKQLLLIGHNQREMLPINGNVKYMERMQKGEVCAICDTGFEDRRALGAHMRHKHGVLGTSSGREGAA